MGLLEHAEQASTILSDYIKNDSAAAAAEKRQERLNMKKSSSNEDDPVMGLLEHAEQASTILSDYIKNEQGKWRRRRGLIRANGGKGREEAMLHVAENLKKICKVTKHNLKEVADKKRR